MKNYLMQLASDLGAFKSLKSVNNFYHESVREDQYSRSFTLPVPIEYIYLPTDE